LEMIEQTSGLLLEREGGVYGFAHRAVQEYLASVHVRDQDLETDLATRVSEPWWHEVIRLHGAAGDATAIVAACLDSSPLSPKALALAFDSVEEGGRVKIELRRRLDNLMAEGV
ncbi:MAG: hypothetical protein GY842_27965, partial [bacterium]|nr:hypothetical protein [bacterium]